MTNVLFLSLLRFSKISFHSVLDFLLHNSMRVWNDWYPVTLNMYYVRVCVFIPENEMRQRNQLIILSISAHPHTIQMKLFAHCIQSYGGLHTSRNVVTYDLVSSRYAL